MPADPPGTAGRIRLAQRATDRPSVADDRVRDHALGVGEDRQSPREQVRLEELTVPRHRPDPDLVLLSVDVAELVGEAVDVNQVLRRRQPQLHHRQQAVAAGEQARFRSELL